MSSHHIIREKQEPALLIANLGNFDTEYLGQLLEWSPTILVNSAVYEQVYSLGIKIDVVVGTVNSSLSLQENIKQIPSDDDFIQASLNFLIREEYPSVNIISNVFNIHDYKNFVDLTDIVVFTADRKIFPVKSGFSKWKPQEENIYIMDNNADITSFKGLVRISNSHFTTEKDGFYELSFSNDYIFIAEEI